MSAETMTEELCPVCEGKDPTLHWASDAFDVVLSPEYQAWSSNEKKPVWDKSFYVCAGCLGPAGTIASWPG